MQPIVILQHNEEVPPGYLGDAIAAAGLPSRVIRLDRGELLPGLDEVGAVVSLGGVMGAYEEDQFPFLALEKEFLRDAVASDIPVLGICLGCQMLAEALGGHAYKADSHEVEFAPLQVADEATADAVIAPLGRSVLSFHGDTWTPPPEASVLATSARHPHAFRLGSAVGVQAHPEASAAIAQSWVALYGPDKLRKEGIDPERLLSDMDAGDEANAERALEMFTAWLDEAVAAQS